MDIRVNGKVETLSQSKSLLQWVLDKALDPNSIVMEYNLEIVKKEEWDNIQLKENDALEVLRFVGGG